MNNKSKQNKKPTMKEMKLAVTNVIKHMSFLQNRIDLLDSVLAGYFEYKKDHQIFPKWFKEKLKERSGKYDKPSNQSSPEGDTKINPGKE